MKETPEQRIWEAELGRSCPAWKIEQIINTFYVLDVHAHQQEWKE